MTIEQTITQMLIKRGLWPAEAQEIIAELKATETGLDDRWEDYAEGYPPQMMAVLWTAAKHQALAWIDKTCPGHFARFMLQASEDEGERQ